MRVQPMKRRCAFTGIVFATALACAFLAAQEKPAAPAARTPQARQTSGGQVSDPLAGFETKVEAYLRKLYAWGPAFQVKVSLVPSGAEGKPAESEIPGFYRLSVQVTFSGESDTATMYVSKDGRHLIRGEVLDTAVDPFAVNRRAIRTSGRPSRGPADARVTVVDFSDFQCPHCKQLDQALRQLLPQYPQVRFVMKHFPLEQIHPWAMTAALAAECAFRLKPDAYWKVHEAIFDQQEAITAENVWQRMQDIVASAGLDPAELRACMASPEAKQAVADDLKEGQVVRIANTPTVFINGRRLVGGDPNLTKQYLDYELSTPTRPSAKP